ncbi:MAG: sensor domain-containing phosphodiesterase [Rhodocyclales bacterium GT-UBC]|nr:MAG: sensor domain-containing phosphodiesterase [Rhodocyclales bacterium GT-UBC]
MFDWLFLNDNALSPAEHARWRVSALRIILISGLVLEAAVALHVALDAIAIAAYHIVVVVVAFYLVLAIGVFHTAKRPNLAAAILLFAVYAAGTTILFLVNVDELAKLGIIFIYTTPIIARLFFGGRLAVALMAFNFLPFFYLLQNGPFVHYLPLNMTLPGSHTYLQSLVFLFFNVCVPLAVFRVLHAFDKSALRHHQTSAALEVSNAQYREFFENAGGAILLCSREGLILQANRMALSLLDAEHDQLVGRSLASCLRGRGDRLPEQVDTERLEEFTGWHWQTDDERQILVEYVTRTAQNSFIVVLRDASGVYMIKEALKRSHEREAFLMYHDALTCLPNRAKLRAHLMETLPLQEAGKVTPLVALRLGSIRHANEKFGNGIGDLLIQYFADEMRRLLPPGSYCARLRSITFLAILPSYESPTEAIRQIERFRLAFPQEFEISGNDVHVQFSTGIALARQGEVSPEELIRRCEVALESARRSKEDSPTLFSEADAALIRRSVDIELGIVSALRNHEFRLVYQPKVDANRQLVGMEALIRWQSPTMGSISPAEFIPIAERAGLIHDLTSFVIEEVCIFIRRLIDQGQDCPPVALNLSAIDIVRHDLIDLIDALTARYAIPPAMLEFEITETGLIGSEVLAISHLQALKTRGFSIAIDDFGTGYSSLSKLSSFPIHKIKIDRSFVMRIGENDKSELIIKAIVSLANLLSCVSIAEGVENEVQERFLKSIGCELFQGYYYHKPLEVQQIEQLLQ